MMGLSLLRQEWNDALARVANSGTDADIAGLFQVIQRVECAEPETHSDVAFQIAVAVHQAVIEHGHHDLPPAWAAVNRALTTLERLGV